MSELGNVGPRNHFGSKCSQKVSKKTKNNNSASPGGGGYLIVKCFWMCRSYGCIFHQKFPTYGSVFNLNSGRWVASSEFLSQLKKFE